MADEWEKVNMAPTWDFEKDKVLIGIYASKEENVGPNESNLYTFEKQDGTKIAVWGNTLLDTRFKNLLEGEEVKIEYLGKQKSEKTQRTYHNFEVYHRPMKKIETDVDADGVPF